MTHALVSLLPPLFSGAQDSHYERVTARGQVNLSNSEEASMKSKEMVQIGDSDAKIRRVIHHRETNLKAGIETGYAEHLYEPIPVWRPINPGALGLDQSWNDGVWRNIYRTLRSRAPDESDRIYGVISHRVADQEIELPELSLGLSAALERFLHQHLR